MNPPDIELGPKMRACTEMERQFVLSYVRIGGNSRDGSEAARQAGYADTGTGAIRVRAHLLLQRERVLDAIDEVARKTFRGQLSLAVTANQRLLENVDHPDHWKAVHSTLSRNGLIERTGVDVNVTGEVTMNHTDAALEDLRALLKLGVPRERLVEAFGFSGLERYERMLAEKTPKVIEHKEQE